MTLIRYEESKLCLFIAILLNLHATTKQESGLLSLSCIHGALEDFLASQERCIFWL